MRIEVINTGTELLLGTTLNTHGGWFGQRLFEMGLRVQRQTTVPDGEAIGEIFEEAAKRSDALLITGGLGPTSDDLTREIIAKKLGLQLHQDEHALRTLESFFLLRGKEMMPANLRQAMVPTGAEVLPNPNGTAPGLYLSPRINQLGNCAIFLLPGPPRELYPIFKEEVVPRLRSLTGGVHIPEVCELKFTGVGESDFHHQIDDILEKIEGLEHGYCARLGELDLRLIGDARAVAKGRECVLKEFHNHLISENGRSMEGRVIDLLLGSKKKLATAESCTGGLISSRLTDVAGASGAYTHGWVTYANDAKIQQLGVPPEIIKKHGAVSSETAEAMAVGALEKSAADMALSVTGIAGPDGGSAEKPVGTAWIGLAQKGKATLTKKVFHPRARQDFKQSVAQSGLDMIRCALEGIER